VSDTVLKPEVWSIHEKRVGAVFVVLANSPFAGGFSGPRIVWM